MDRPYLDELLAAVCGHLEAHVIPAVKADAKLYFQTLVAANVLKIAERELALGWVQAGAEWARLNALLGTDEPLPADPSTVQPALAERNRALCEAIRAGAFDDEPAWTALFEHLLETARAALEIANPKFLAALAAEDEGI